MALASITPTGSAFITASPATSNVQLSTSGSPTEALIVNTGDQVAYVTLGSANTVTAAPYTGTAIPLGQSVVLALGSNTYLAACSLSRNVGLEITLGT